MIHYWRERCVFSWVFCSLLAGEYLPSVKSRQFLALPLLWDSRALMLLLLHSPLQWVKERTSHQFYSLFFVLWKTWGAGNSDSLELLKVVYCKRFSVWSFVVFFDKDVNKRNYILNIFNYRKSVFSQRRKRFISTLVWKWCNILHVCKHQGLQLFHVPCSLLITEGKNSSSV